MAPMLSGDMNALRELPVTRQVVAALTPAPMTAPGLPADWRDQLPTLVGTHATLRDLKLSDAPGLLSSMTAEAVARFISTPPDSVEGFERFIQWAHFERKMGRYACFAIVPHGMTHAVGIFQVRQLEPGFATAEWGFALRSDFWGTGIFLDGARLVVDFAVETVGVHRLEARSAVVNGRGNGALRKLGAVQEGVLRRSFRKDGGLMDQSLWSILADEWRQAKIVRQPAIVH